MGNYIKEIKIFKVRHLKNFDIPISTNGECRHLILTGINGSGKTSLVTSIAAFLDKIIIQRWVENYRSKKEILETGLTYITDLDDEKFKIALRIIGKKMDEIKRNQKSITMSDVQKIEEMKKKFIPELDSFIYKTGGIDLIFDSIENVLKSYQEHQFILDFFSAGRSAQFHVPEGIKKLDFKQQDSVKQKISDLFIQYIVNLKAERSFAKDEADDKTVQRVDKWFDCFVNNLKKIFGRNDLRFQFDRKNYNFNILLKDREPVTLNQLSDGFSAIIHIITQLLLRVDAYAHGYKAFDIEGIVLIDEIETHLHVELEKKILPFLTSFFPKIQFIVTTHSPFVLSSISNAVICDLEKKTVTTDLSGYSYSALIESYFDTDKYSDEIKKQIKEYEELVSKKSLSSEKKKRMIELEFYLDNIPKTLNKELFLKYSELRMHKGTV